MKFFHIPPEWEGKVMNIHPALIPLFCGKDLYGSFVHEAVVEAGVKVSGCTVHFADNVYDNGPIIVQHAVPVHDTDTPDDVAVRVFAEECKAFPEAISLFQEERLVIEGRRVKVLPPV
jgi:folate-dependent phosphoribosylglycinamide formyltransferase PurN